MADISDINNKCIYIYFFFILKYLFFFIITYSLLLRYDLNDTIKCHSVNKV